MTPDYLFSGAADGTVSVCLKSPTQIRIFVEISAFSKNKAKKAMENVQI